MLRRKLRGHLYIPGCSKLRFFRVSEISSAVGGGWIFGGYNAGYGPPQGLPRPKWQSYHVLRRKDAE